NHFLNLTTLQEHSDAKAIDTRVVADDGEVLGAFPAHGFNQVLRNAAQPEAAHEYGGAVSEFFDGGVGGGDAFVHSRAPKFGQGSLLHPAADLKSCMPFRHSLLFSPKMAFANRVAPTHHASRRDNQQANLDEKFSPVEPINR